MAKDPTGNNLESLGSVRKNKKGALKTVKGHFVWKMAVADTKVPLFNDHFWHFQIKIRP